MLKRAFDRQGTLPYSPHTVLTAALAIVIAMTLLPLVQMLTMPLANRLGELGQLFQYSVIMIAVLVFNALFVRRINAQDLGFTVNALGPIIAYSVVFAVVFNIIVMVAETLNPDLASASADVFQSLQIGKSTIHDIIIIATVTVFAPMWEELVFRGLAFRAVRDGLHARLPDAFALGLALIVSAWLFTDAHGGGGQAMQLFYLFIFGIMLASVYRLTGSILTAMLLHSFNNSYVLATGLLKHNIALSSGLNAYCALLGPAVVFILFFAIRALYPSHTSSVSSN